MNQNLWLGLANNASLLLALFIIYEISYLVVNKNHALRQVVNGILIAGICIAIMSLPYQLYPGIVFDTRSILISVTALTFGIVPAGMVAVISVIFRIIIGGAGTFAGIATILASAIIGLIWRQWAYPKQKKFRWLNIYLMSLAVHIVLLLCMLILPEIYELSVINSIALPLMLIYPIVSVLLSMMLLHQQERRQYQEDLKINEEKYRRITENISDVVWTADLNLNTTYVSSSVEKLLGESPAQHMKRSAEEKLPPESLKRVEALFLEEQKKESDLNCKRDRTRIIELEHYKSDGTTVWISMHISFLRDSIGNPIGFQGISRDISERKETERALEKERRKAQMYLDIARVIIIAFDRDMTVTLINQEGCEVLGSSKDDIIGKNWLEHYIPDSYKPELEKGLQDILEDNISNYVVYKNPIITANKGERMISWHNAVLKDDAGKVTGILSSGIDITDQNSIIEALRESERSKSVLISHLPGIAYRCDYDREWTMKFISEGCYAVTGYKAEDLINNNKLPYSELICKEYCEGIWHEWKLVIGLKIPFRYEYEIITASGERKWVMEMAQAIFTQQGDVQALEGIIIDITESKKAQEHIQYMDVHDFMTGLYNRKKYELEKQRLDRSGIVPVSIIIADINGVRIINDAFGHVEGDRIIIETAKIINSCCRESDLLARTGGDEFSILMTNTNREEANAMMNRIQEACDRYNLTISNTERYISLSIGFETKDRRDGSLEESEKKAEEYLRKRKMFEHKSYHSAILSSIMATMYARSHETEEHAMRIAKLCITVGERIGLPQQLLDELHLFSMLHDIGKVGIDDSILNKPGPLTEEEWVVMKTHPEIGCRIAMSAYGMESVAEYILAHHERWDGQGYPQGTSGEDIPLLSRILAIADSFDAMTENRVYRQAVAQEAALDEIEKNAGKQFDPNIVEMFVSVMRES